MTTKQLLPHQIEDAEFLASKAFAGNFSKMRTGKTLTALEAVRLVAANCTIIVGPPISLSMWQKEFEDFFPGQRAQILKAGTSKISPHAGAYIMSYQIATKRRDELKELCATVLICDESHALKSIDAKRTAAIIGKHGLCESVSHTFLLSGSPSTKYNDDMFTFLARADYAGLKDRIGEVDMSRFRLRYCVTQERRFHPYQKTPTIVTVGNRNTEELNNFIFDGGLAVRRETVEGMPDLTTNRLQIGLEMTDELKQLLLGFKKLTPSQQDNSLSNLDVGLATIRRLLGKGKVKAAVAEIVERIDDNNGPILLGAWHTEVIIDLHDAITSAGIGCAVIDGRTSPTDRDVYIDDFNRGIIQVLIGQISAMGVAIDLSPAGGHIVVVEEDWSPAIMEQFFYRMMNFGDTAHHVHADILTTDTDLDKAVARINATKTRGHKTLMQIKEKVS